METGDITINLSVGKSTILLHSRQFWDVTQRSPHPQKTVAEETIRVHVRRKKTKVIKKGEC